VKLCDICKENIGTSTTHRHHSQKNHYSQKPRSEHRSSRDLFESPRKIVCPQQHFIDESSSPQTESQELTPHVISRKNSESSPSPQTEVPPKVNREESRESQAEMSSLKPNRDIPVISQKNSPSHINDRLPPKPKKEFSPTQIEISPSLQSDAISLQNQDKKSSESSQESPLKFKSLEIPVSTAVCSPHTTDLSLTKKRGDPFEISTPILKKAKITLSPKSEKDKAGDTQQTHKPLPKKQEPPKCQHYIILTVTNTTEEDGEIFPCKLCSNTYTTDYYVCFECGVEMCSQCFEQCLT